jgi:hypothetical protein
MIYRPGRGYAVSMFCLAGLLFCGAAAQAMQFVASDLPCCTLAFCVLGGIFLAANGLLVGLSSITLDTTGVEIRVWFRKKTIHWDQLRGWAILRHKAGDYKDRLSVRVHLEHRASVLDIWDWEVQRPGLDSFVEELRNYCGSKEGVTYIR